MDPELLGKVFENLLASYNEETRTTARKETGSFYTPREIVSYMVDETLLLYLHENVPDTSMDDLRALFAACTVIMFCVSSSAWFLKIFQCLIEGKHISHKSSHMEAYFRSNNENE